MFCGADPFERAGQSDVSIAEGLEGYGVSAGGKWKSLVLPCGGSATLAGLLPAGGVCCESIPRTVPKVERFTAVSCWIHSMFLNPT